jgi:CRISPR-associated protein Csx3
MEKPKKIHQMRTERRGKMAKIVLCGPPHSGKSCLREGLKQAIKRIPGAPYPYVIPACPDGEGAWFQEAASRDPELARKLKEAYKAKFTPEFAARLAESVEKCTLPLTIVDVGGRMSEENRMIMAPATHAVILAGDMSKVHEWQCFCESLGLLVVAVICSDYCGTEDYINTLEPVLTGSVHHLERGEDNSQRPMVKALANLLVHLSE